MAPQLLASFPPLLGYLPREHLASGGQSSVYRALNPSTDHLAALKVVPLVLSASSPDPERERAAVQAKAKQLVREMRIHETLKHRNVLRLFGGETREECEVESGKGRRVGWPAGLYMLLDLADGGDLFDKITPDVGVAEDIAHLYFKQLISGLKYLNHHGICHRDVKPENCLLDGHGNLLLSDFGLATVFKYKSQTRLLKDRCGSPPYAAPELARAQAYEAEPVDVWSAGVVLFALLFGNTPWDEPTPSSPEFAAFLSSRPPPSSSSTSSSALLPLPPFEPWTRLPPDSGAAQLLLRMLTVDPKERVTLAGVEREGWYRQPNPFLDPATGLVPPSESHVLLQRLLAALHGQGYIGAPEPAYEELMSDAMDASQPPSATQAALSQKLSQRGLDPQQSFRSSLQLYSRLSMAPTQRTNPHLTRFFTTQPLPVLLSLLSRALDSLALPTPSNAPSSAKAHELLHSSTGGGGGNAPAAPGVEEIRNAPLGTLLARFRIRSVDKRGQRLWVGVHVSKSVLPPSSPGGASQSQGGGAGMGMDVDSDDDEGPPVGGQGGHEQEEEKGEEGLDVVCLKRDADPLEMKRLWREVLRRMPEGVVVAT
ncbi:hypothetical protein JCM6882_004572 [Rhodosporidiobolus microsporus]